jgi:hypothetical protein
MPGKKGLGRGFDALIPTDVLDETFDVTAEQDEKTSELRYLKLTDIEPNPDQPRKDFDNTVTAAIKAGAFEIEDVVCAGSPRACAALGMHEDMSCVRLPWLWNSLV